MLWIVTATMGGMALLLVIWAITPVERPTTSAQLSGHLTATATSPVPFAVNSDELTRLCQVDLRQDTDLARRITAHAADLIAQSKWTEAETALLAAIDADGPRAKEHAP